MIPARPFIEPVLNCPDSALPRGGRRTTFHALCKQAGIASRAEAPRRALLLYRGRRQLRAPSADAVGVPTRDLDSPEAALRALEALAHSFHDHAARFCVCGRGLFSAPTRRAR